MPEPGFTRSGRYIPAGTTVGVYYSWVSQHDQNVFAPDPDTFRPERWLVSDPKTLTAMEKSHIPFGVGLRNCQGQNVAMDKIFLSC
jgi:cytochrome P450